MVWARNHLKYSCGWDLCQIFGRQEQIPKEYFDFVKDYPINNKKALICSEYYHYLNHYFTSYFLYQKKKRALEIAKNGNWNKFLSVLSDTIIHNFNGISKDIFLSQSYHMTLQKDVKAVDTALTKYRKNFTSEFIASKLDEEIKKYQLAHNPEPSGIKFLKVKNSQRNFLTELLSEKFQGKIVYIDLWGTWCGPCLKEMPYSKILHEKFKNKDIVFLYLCCRSTKENWKKVIKEKIIKGQHIWLNNDQYNILSAQYDMQGIPWYLIVNRNGKIINENAPRPSSPKTKKILKNLINNNSL